MKKKAFTILELVIALSIFVVGMVSILEIFPVNRRFLAQSSMLTQASYLAQEGIEATRALDYGSLTVGVNPYFEVRHFMSATAGDQLSLFERRTEVELVDPATLGSSNTDQHLKKIETIVYWTENNNPRQYAIDTYVYQ